MSKWIMYFDGGVEWFETEQEAVDAADDAIIDCKESGEWVEEVEGIVVAKVTHTVKCFPDPVGPDGRLQIVDYRLKEVGDGLVDALKVTCNPLCLQASATIEQILGDVKMWESQASDSWAKYQDMKKACDDRDDAIQQLRDELAQYRPESWARITKRLTDERDKLQKVLTEIRTELYGQGFRVLGWHLNGDEEPLDSWFEENEGWLE